jgi:hypothetical protein
MSYVKRKPNLGGADDVLWSQNVANHDVHSYNCYYGYRKIVHLPYFEKGTAF